MRIHFYYPSILTRLFYLKVSPVAFLFSQVFEILSLALLEEIVLYSWHRCAVFVLVGMLVIAQIFIG